MEFITSNTTVTVKQVPTTIYVTNNATTRQRVPSLGPRLSSTIAFQESHFTNVVTLYLEDLECTQIKMLMSERVRWLFLISWFRGSCVGGPRPEAAGGTYMVQSLVIPNSLLK